MRNAYVRSTGMYVPEKVIPNSYFDELLNENVSEWLEQNVEIYNRRWCSEEESTSDLCVNAAKDILKSSGLNPEDIDLLIIATDTPEYISPSTASKVQYLCGFNNAGSFDLNSACSGYVAALDVAAKYIKSDEQYNNIMVIGAYAMSKHLNMLDKKTVTLFADGAAGCILSATDNWKQGFLGSETRTKGEYCDWMGIYAGGTYKVSTHEVIDADDHKLKFVKKFPPELNPETWSDMTFKLAKRLKYAPSDFDHYFITQININSIRATMDLLELDHAKAHTVMHQYGYTGSACIPMAMHVAIENGHVKRGDKLLLIGSGGGLTFASMALTY